MGCLTDDVILDLVEARLAPAVAAAARAHLDGCERCRTVAAEAASFFEDPTTQGASMLGRPLQTGDRVARYEVLSLVGVGGMGVVYRARDVELSRFVALKVLRQRPSDAHEPVALERRLLGEARAMAQLSHPNIVALYDVGTHDGQVFLAMEYVEGVTLTAWLRESKRSWAEVFDVFAHAGDGLAAAHQRSIVHRDFKPDNVLIGDDGRVRVTDFGLARDERTEHVPGQPPTAGALDVAKTLTATGVLLGTPAYMGPEQFLNEAVTAKTDQFSFCVALHEALYGQRPFEGKDFDSLSSSVVSGLRLRPPASSGVPAALEAILQRGLKPHPDERFASMAELLTAIADVRERLRSEKTSAPRRLPRVALSFGAGAAVMLAVGAAYFLGRPPPAAPPLRASSEVAREPVPARGAAPVTDVGPRPRDGVVAPEPSRADAPPPAQAGGSTTATPALAHLSPDHSTVRSPTLKRTAPANAVRSTPAPRAVIAPAGPKRYGDGIKDF